MALSSMLAGVVLGLLVLLVTEATAGESDAQLYGNHRHLAPDDTGASGRENAMLKELRKEKPMVNFEGHGQKATEIQKRQAQAGEPSFLVPTNITVNSISVPESVAPDSSVLTLVATDPDADILTYNIESQVPSSPAFYIDAATDELRVPANGLDAKTTSSFVFVFGVTDGNHEVDSEPFTLNVTSVNNTWTVWLKTGDVLYAGSDAGVFIRVVGENGETAAVELDNSYDNFERNNWDWFVVTLKDVGQLKNLTVWHDDTGTSPGWFLDEIWMFNDETLVNFHCYAWLANETGYQLSWTLYPYFQLYM